MKTVLITLLLTTFSICTLTRAHADPRAYGGPATTRDANARDTDDRPELGLGLFNLRSTLIITAKGPEEHHTFGATWAPSFFFNETWGVKGLVSAFPLERYDGAGSFLVADFGAALVWRTGPWEFDLSGIAERWYSRPAYPGTLWFLNGGWFGIGSDLSSRRKSGLVLGWGRSDVYGGVTQYRMGLEIRF